MAGLNLLKPDMRYPDTNMSVYRNSPDIGRPDIGRWLYVYIDNIEPWSNTKVNPTSSSSWVSSGIFLVGSV
jgi:hypothetical protein